MENNIWVEIPVSERLPEIGEDVLCSWDGGKTYPEECTYLENRQCMLAGVGGGNGYFGKGWATNGSTGCEKGLILDAPTHWLSKHPLPDAVGFSREDHKNLSQEGAEY